MCSKAPPDPEARMRRPKQRTYRSQNLPIQQLTVKGTQAACYYSKDLQQRQLDQSETGLQHIGTHGLTSSSSRGSLTMWKSSYRS